MRLKPKSPLRPFLRVAFVSTALLFAACDAQLSLSRVGDKVAIPASYGSCTKAQECTLTGADCSDCCGVAAVREDSEEKIYVAVQRSCQSYKGTQCNLCNAIPREITCVDGRCTLVHSSTCSVGIPARVSPTAGLPASPGDTGIKDPFSCNTCTCQPDGTLLCGSEDCPVPCSRGLAPGTTCDSCGYNENCDVLRTACLPSCETTADCAGTPLGVCSSGVCKRVCGTLP
jgi:hypothetical protein